MAVEIGVHVGTPLLIYGANMWGSIISAGANLLGGMMSASASKSAARKQVELQREFAQNGIRWKVADAKAAGLHPLAALGAQTTSYQPVQVGDTSLGSSLSEMGQNIGRAVDATMTRREREEQQRRNDLIQGMQLANQEAELKSRLASTASQIKLNDAHARYFEAMASVAGQPRNPPFPVGGAMTALQETPKQIKQIDINQAGTENAVGDSDRYLENRDGTLSIAPGKEHSLAAQDMDIPLGGNMYNMAWMYDTYLKPWAAGFLPGYKPRETVYKGQVYRYRRYTGRMHPTGIFIKKSGK